MIYHVLKDGSITTDITGHIVKVSEAETLYNYMNELHKRGSKSVKTDKDRQK